jgi:hypothetical protein
MIWSKETFKRLGWYWHIGTVISILLFASSYYAHERHPDHWALAKISNNTESLAVVMATPYLIVPVTVKETYERRDRIRAYIQDWFRRFEALLDRMVKIVRRGLFDILWPDIIHSCTVVYDLILAPFFRLLVDIPCWIVWKALSLVHILMLAVASAAAVCWEIVYGISRSVLVWILEPTSLILKKLLTVFE